MKLQWLSDQAVWGIYVKPDTTIQPSKKVLLGSGQITVVAPTGFEIKEIKNHMGSWHENARVNHPIENPTMDYISFGIINSEEITTLGNSEEVLVLTIEAKNKDCPSTLSLIEKTDPFSVSPNSYNTNPGNDLKMIDLVQNRAIYDYKGNYELEAWNCKSEGLSTSNTDLDKSKGVKVFPNPFKGQIVFEKLGTALHQDYQIQIFDNFGRMMKNYLLKDQRTSLQLPKDTPMFFYQIIETDTRQLIDSGKLVQQKGL
jgi:hypothetical protein